MLNCLGLVGAPLVGALVVWVPWVMPLVGALQGRLDRGERRYPGAHKGRPYGGLGIWYTGSSSRSFKSHAICRSASASFFFNSSGLK